MQMPWPKSKLNKGKEKILNEEQNHDTRKFSLSKEDETYRKEARIKVLQKQKSLAHFNTVTRERDGVSKSKLQSFAKMWMSKAAEVSDSTYKELNLAKEIIKSPDLLQEQPIGRKQSFSSFPAIEGALLLSHEGKQQVVQPSRAKNTAPIFVRLALLRRKDVFGLDTLDFDANYTKTDISVCLVSCGAEVLMIRKKLFLDNCTSEHLEHLRNLVTPYPLETTMQENLQISADWDVFCNEQLEKAKDRLKEKLPFR